VTDTLERQLREALAPDLEVVRVLGHGSVASVYQAKEPSLKRLVAVKVLRPEVASDDTARRRFEREAQAAARLNHSNLTDIYRVGRLDGLPFIVMEFIDGRNLADAMKAGGPLTVAETKHAILGVASALGQAHANGIIHRDVRPANVLREDSTDRIVLTDFGIAALLETGGDTSTQLTTMGHRVGDLRYMSPEQLTGETLTVQADMYSLGVLGYVLLTGEGPFPGGRANEVAQKLHGKARPLRELRPDVDPQLAAVLERCLARNPEHRPRAADAVRALSGGAAELPARDQTVFGAFLNELKRRKVSRVAGTYLAISVVVTGLSDAISNAYPGTLILMQVLIALLAIGFPVSVSLAWVYDVREGRVKRTPSPDEVEGIGSTGLPIMPLVGLTVSVVFAIAMGWWLFRKLGST
jgi:serine/threonine protein kinase